MKVHDENDVEVTKHENRLKKQSNPETISKQKANKDYWETHDSNSKPKRKDRNYHRVITTIER